jgi:D-alanyl-D-alanine carboxypeptidase
MGFAAGTQLTVDNALKMMMVKSANDIAVVLAEAVGGSVEGFADQMNAASRRLGMTQSSWVNPNGLPADEQITSPRDMAILARAILRELPEYEMYWHIPAIKFGRRVMHNTNGLIGRYPDADGMKTGFICASGFNVVATATRGGRKLIVVVFGSTSGAVRSEKAAQLFEKGFSNTGLSWLMPSLGTVDALQPIAAAPPNLRDDMCGKNRRRPATESADEEETPSADTDSSSAFAATLLNMRGGAPKNSGPLLGPMAAFVPIPVYIGPKKNPGDPTLVAAAPKRKKPSAETAAVATAASKETLAKPALANAAGGAKSKTRQSATFAPASAKETPAAPPGEKKKDAATKPKKTAAKPVAKPDETPAKP